MTSGVLMLVIFVVIPLIVGGILLAVLLPKRKRNAAARPDRPRPAAEGGKGVQKSLDRLYAERNGQKLCPWCETVNPGGAAFCAACGKKI